MPRLAIIENIPANEIIVDAIPITSVVVILEIIIQKTKPEIIKDIDSIYKYAAPCPTIRCLSYSFNCR